MQNDGRVYRSELREAQAAATRARILDAAGEEFAAKGFAGATLSAIATAAGVSVETVKLHGAKRDLLLAAWNHRLGGPSPDMPFLEDPSFRDDVASIPDAALPRAIAEMAADISARGAALWLALTGAARVDETLEREVAAQVGRRNAEFALMIDEFARRGIARTDRSRAHLAAGLAFILSAEGYEQLVRGWGLTHVEYVDWLADAIARLILAEH